MTKMDKNECYGCQEILAETWLIKFPGISYCAVCVEEQGEPEDTDIEQECTQCDTPLELHHQSQCPVCSECKKWCGHLIAYSPKLFDSEGPQLLDWPNIKPIERLIEAHEAYGSAYWEAKERITDDDEFLSRWEALQESNSTPLKAIYGEHWKFECHDEWINESDEWEPLLLILLDGMVTFLIDTEGGGAAGACWESQNVYVEDHKAAKKLANQNATIGAKNLQGITKQIAAL